MVSKKKNKRKFGIALTGLAAAGMFAATIPALQVSANDEAANLIELPLIEISMQDSNPLSTLKKEIITERASYDETISLDDIDVERSTLDIVGFDRTTTGIQSVTAKVSLVSAADSSKSIGYSFTQDATVKMVKSSAPQLKLKSKNITVNNGDAWNPSSYIAYIHDDSGILPTLKVSGTPDMSTDGNYTVKYTVVDLEGNTTSADLTVTVKTPEEVIRAREEEARRQAEEEEAARIAAEEEEAARIAAEEEEAQRLLQEQQQQAQSDFYSAGSGAPVTGGGSNPFGGGWSNCTWSAWQLAYENTGVALPSLGNAGSWLANASASGYATGGSPAVGSVVVYSNHVAYVDAVGPDGSYHIAEGGYNGGYNERWVSGGGLPDGQSLYGFIYVE